MHDTRRTRLVLGVLLVAAVALITLDYRGGAAAPLGGARGAAGAVFGPAESALATVTQPVARLFGGGSSGSQGQVAALRREVVRLRAELSQAQLSKSQESQLRRMLALAGRGGYRVVPATVVASGTSYERSVTIDAGRRDGIRPQETVLNGDGLVGTVTSVTSRTATVVLLTDRAATVGVRMAGGGQLGTTTGAGGPHADPGTLQLQLYDANAVVKPGERMVTLGSVNNKPYVPGVPVGTVVRVEKSANSLTKRAVVRPFADVASLGVVGVVVAPPRTNPRDSVLPPKPSPSPSPSGSPGPSATPSASPSVSASASSRPRATATTSTGAGPGTGG